MAIIGRYILSPSVIDELSKKRVGVGGEIQLTDAIKNSLSLYGAYGYKFEGKLLNGFKDGIQTSPTGEKYLIRNGQAIQKM